MPYTSVRAIELIDVGSYGKETLSNDGMENLARGVSGTTTIALAATDVTLTDVQAQAFVLILTGTLTANVNALVPPESRVYIADNRTTGAFTVTMRPVSGSGVAVDQGVRTLVYSDGTAVYPVASGSGGGGGSGAPTDASYLVGAGHALLTGERVVTNTPTVTWDLATAGQAQANVPNDAITYGHLQPVTAKRVLGRANPATGDVQEIAIGAGLSLSDGGILDTASAGPSQPLDATLTALGALSTGTNQLPYFTGTDTADQTTLTAFARTVLDDADQAAMQTTLGVVPGTTVQPLDATLTALAGVTTGADMLPFFTGTDLASTTTLTAFMRSLLDDPDAATARDTLGVAGATAAPLSAEYITSTANATLTAERVLTDTATVMWDFATAGQAKAHATAAGGAPTDAEYIVSAPHVTLTGERVLTDTASVTWDFTTAGQAKATAVAGASASQGAEVERMATTQSIAQNMNVAVIFDTEVRDDNNFWASGQPTRLTAPTAGWYTITAFIQWDATASQTRIVNLRINGTNYIAVTSESAAGVDQRQSLAMNWYLSAGDYIEVILFQTTAATRAITARASIVGMTAAPLAATTFLALTDTPDVHTGNALKILRANAAENAVEYGPVLGSMATQDANAVAITGGSAALGGAGTGLAQLTVRGNTLANDFANIWPVLRLYPHTSMVASIVHGIRVEAPVVSGAGTLQESHGLLVLDPPAAAGLVTGVRTLISSGTNRWGIYAQGTAPSYFGGTVQVAGSLGVHRAPVASELISLVLNPGAFETGIVAQMSPDQAGTWAMNFKNAAGSSVGTISLTASATAYNTSSDVRLKENIQGLLGALDVIRALRPVSFRWQADGSKGIGFLAHELQQAIPEAVTGLPDEVNDDGSIRPQGVDHSRLVPWLTACCQELAAQVQALTARITTLEEALGL